MLSLHFVGDLDVACSLLVLGQFVRSRSIARWCSWVERVNADLIHVRHLGFWSERAEDALTWKSGHSVIGCLDENWSRLEDGKETFCSQDETVLLLSLRRLIDGLCWSTSKSQSGRFDVQVIPGSLEWSRSALVSLPGLRSGTFKSRTESHHGYFLVSRWIRMRVCEPSAVRIGSTHSWSHC